MALGDSITVGFSDEANGGYRGPLYQMLVNAGDVIDFVGSQQGGAIAAPHHEGHSGQKADWIRDRVYNWLKATPAEFVLLHIGTNNIDQLEKADQITTEIAQILNEIDRYETFSRTTVTVIVARIINRADPRGALGLETTKLNKSIESMAAARIADGDRLLVADFEPALSYPEDIFVSVPPPVHPNASGYAKMAKVWFDALSIALSNKIIPGQGYTLDILTGLAVNQNGILEMTSVVDLEHWKPLVPIGDPVFTPGAPVAMAKQTDGVLTALAVDKYGRLVVASVGGAGIWQPPVGISDAIFNPGTPVAMAKQTDGILSALAIDKGGRLMVASVAGLGLWQRPVGISDSVFIPGSPLAMAKQTDGVLTALAVDKYGRLVVASVPGLGSWQPPIGISDTIFLPGTPVAMAKQTDGVLTALAVDKYGRLVVASVPGLGTWQAPVSISSPIFTRGTAVALAKQIDGVNLSTFIKNQPEFSGSRITQRIGQLTGDGLDPEYRHIPGNVKRVFNSTAAHGVLGVDLGANTEFQGKLVFFFGDVPTFGQANDQADWVAFHSDRVDPWFGFSLSSVDGPDGKFQPFSIKDIGPLGIGQTPTGAFSFPGKDSAGDKEQAYVFAFYFPDDPGQRGSLLVKSSDPTQPVEFDHVFSFSTFNERSGRFFQGGVPWLVSFKPRRWTGANGPGRSRQLCSHGMDAAD